MSEHSESMIQTESNKHQPVEEVNRYDESKIYFLWCSDEYFYIGSTIESINRRLARHKQDSKKFPHRKVYAHINELGWDEVRIELIEAFSCNSRKELHEKENEYISSLIGDERCLNEKAAHLTEEELLAMQAAYRQDHRNKILAYKERYRKECADKIAKYNKQYAETHKEEILQKNKIYKQENKEKLAKFYKEYAQKHKEKIADYKHSYAIEHADELKQKNMEYREVNKEKISELGRKYYEENRDAILERNRKYQEANKEKLAKQQAEYRKKMKEMNPRVSKLCTICGGSYQDHHKQRHEASNKHQSFM